MGGSGSGRPGWRPIAEQSLKWRIGELATALAIVAPQAPGARYQGAMTWSRASYTVAKAGYTLARCNDALALVISYTLRGNPIHDVIELTATPCNYGGVRWWFVCPDCNRRVGCLFNPRDYWRCRHCRRITYESSNDSHRYDGLMRRLGADPSVLKLLFR